MAAEQTALRMDAIGRCNRAPHRIHIGSIIPSPAVASIEAGIEAAPVIDRNRRRSIRRIGETERHDSCNYCEQLFHDSLLRPITRAKRLRPYRSLESVRRDHTGLHSFLNMSLMEARRRNASALRLRFSQSLESRLHRPSHANVRSTTHRFGKTTKPLARSERLTISTFTCVIIFVTARRNTGP